MQPVLSMIWNRVVVSISYNDNYYTTGTFYEYNLFGSLLIQYFTQLSEIQ